MAFGVVIRWVDRQWEEYPNAVHWLGLLVAAAWLPATVFEPHPIWLGAAIVWSAFWTVIFVWRWLAWLHRLDGKCRRRRNR